MNSVDLLKGLSIFLGIGGIDLALRDFVEPVAYCEIEPYCQSVLLQRMQAGDLPKAPIWDDIRTLSTGSTYKEASIDIIYGGFPCQDISVAGLGKGLAGERSGLFFEIMRLAKEIKPKFIFLENTKGILSNGGIEVIETLTSIGYSCRWITKSCKEVGSPQNRERWFCLAYAEHIGLPSASTLEGSQETIRIGKKRENEAIKPTGSNTPRMLSTDSTLRPHNPWDTEPPICRVATRIPFAMERIKSLGNSVCIEQTREAFKELIGLN